MCAVRNNNNEIKNKHVHQGHRERSPARIDLHQRHPMCSDGGQDDEEPGKSVRYKQNMERKRVYLCHIDVATLVGFGEQRLRRGEV
jgi:hypothetical protein